MAKVNAFNNWVEDRRKVWGGALGNFLLENIAKAIIKPLEDVEPLSKEQTKSIMAKLRANPNTPKEVLEALDHFEKGGFAPLMILGVVMAVAMVIQTIQVLWTPLNKQMSYPEERAAKTFRFNADSVIAAWRRNPEGYNILFEDLRDQGWDEGRIATLKMITEVIPQAQDIIRFALREVYSPEIAEKYGQFQDIPTAAYGDAAKAGLPKDTFDKFWAAHWYLPSSSDGFELLHRGIITGDELKALLKANDIMPYWRDQLIKLSWNIPTRVDVRRFWDMRTIDEARLREIYTGLGYHDKDLEDYILWTKIFVDFPDLLARYKNGWITIDQVKDELIAMGMKPDRADTLIEEKIKKAAPERVAAEKDLTKSDIINGVKKDVITREEGAELLTEIGYSNDEALYLLDVNIPVDEETKVVTARELTKSDILAGLKTGVITEADALSKLLELRYTAVDANFLLKIYKAAVKPAEEPKLKEASKADIVTAVKKGLITQEDGYMMLIDIGFAADAAIFILSIAAEQSPFSPVNYAEFKDLTAKYRKASGLEGPEMNEDIKRAAAEVIRVTTERDSLQRSITAEQRGLLTEGGVPVEATARLTQLQTSLRKAEAELSRVKSEYSRLVAEFKHTV